MVCVNFRDLYRQSPFESTKMTFRSLSVFLTVLCLLPLSAQADDPPPVDAAKFKKTVSQGVAFLMEKGQDRSDGSYSKQLSPAVTAICITALIKNGVDPQNPEIVAGFKYLEQFAQEDGGFYKPDSGVRNYETSIILMAYAAANKNHQHDDRIRKAAEYLKKLQWDDEEGHDSSSSFYGGQGYGSGKRPDASNTSFFIDALKASGEDPESPAMKKAMIFMSRCQNLASPDNTAGFAAQVTADDRGGFIYSPANNGESKAGETDAGGLRSYGSMTYTGLKSFLYAGVTKDDIRVKAAQDWIRRHYDLKTNPGVGDEGLYYYYHVFGKALATFGDRYLVDHEAKAHNWRAELVDELAARQRDDGSWVNTTDRWYEGDPNLVTAYALLALSYAHPDQDK